MRTKPAAMAGVIALLLGTVAVTSATAATLDDRTNVDFRAEGLSSEYHVYADGIDPDEPVGLLLQFHGDGGYEFRNPSSTYSLGGPEGIVAQARDHNLITVAVRTPDWGTRTWWREGSENADYVAALVDHLRDEYPVRADRTWLVGYSGGAQFITQFYLPKHSDTIEGGGSVVFGGGGVPYRVDVQPFDDGLKQQFPMHWFTGERDDGRDGSYNALRDARRGSAWYEERGFDTDLEVPEGVGHGLSGRFGPVVGGHLDDHAGDVAVTPPDGPDPEPEPDPEDPAEEVTVTDHDAVRTDRGMIFTGTVAGADRVVLRASRNPLDGQTGWWLRGEPDADGAVRIELTKFDDGVPYWWQLEDTDGTVLVEGELPGEPAEPDDPEPEPDPVPEPDVDEARAAVVEAQTAVTEAQTALDDAAAALDAAVAALDG